jgi:hypothetical protein
MYTIDSKFTVASASETTATLTQTDDRYSLPTEVRLTWPSVAKKPSEFVVGASVTVRVQA